MSKVACITLDGHTKMVQKDTLILHPAAYAIVVHQQKLLLLKLRATGKYHLPGGGIEVGERIEETLKRELKEETGILIEVGELVYLKEFFFYYDPSGKAYHGLHFFYACTPKTTKLIADELVEDGAAEQPRWEAIDALRAEDFQIDGNEILNLLSELENT